MQRMRGCTQGSFLLPLYALAVHPVFDAVMMGVVVINVIFMAGARTHTGMVACVCTVTTRGAPPS